MNIYHEPLNCLLLSNAQCELPSPLVPYTLSMLASILSPPHPLLLSAQARGQPFSSGSYKSNHQSGGD